MELQPKDKEDRREPEPLMILQKIQDMWSYAYPIVNRWSVREMYAIGNRVMDTMNEMLALATDIRWKWSKKTSVNNLDYANKQLQTFIQVAFDNKVIKGLSTYKEWNRRSEEIGKMIGGYKESVEKRESSQDTGGGKTAYRNQGQRNYRSR